MPYIEEILEKFNQMPLEFKLTVDGEWVSEKLAVIEKKYNLNLCSLLIFCAMGEVPLDGVGGFLEQENGLDALTAQAVQEDLKTAVFEPMFVRLEFINSNPKKIMTIKQEAFYLLDVFDKNLLREFVENPIITDIINARIFNIFRQDLSFKDELEKALFKNQELLSDKDFFIDGKKFQPTIENWLVDFMRNNGTDIFDKLLLTEYIIKNKNCRLLDEHEKMLLKKTLLLYRNLKFFPLSMPSDNVDEWEIIPLDKPTADPVGKTSLDIPKTQEEKAIERILVEKNNYSQSSLEQAALDEEIKRKRHLEDLRIEANKYVPGSLERMVLEEEISKLEK